VQKKWGELGGYTCDAKILASEEFRKATPYNEAFYESMQMVKDFWTIPEYADMLSTANKHWHAYIVANKGGSAQDVQDALMKDWEAILKKANLLQ
jgi:multiple sugar transport system substrate-binding protein